MFLLNRITFYYILTGPQTIIVFFLEKAWENNGKWRIGIDYFFNGNCRLNGVSDD